MAQLWTMRVGLRGQYDESPFLDGNFIGLDSPEVGNVKCYDDEEDLSGDLEETREDRAERGSSWVRQI